MELRKFDIEFDSFLGEWHINLKGYNGDKIGNYSRLISPIIHIENSQIVHIFNSFISDKTIKNANNDKLMQEVCEFRHEDYKFSGTFIDALEYIKENFKDIE